MDKDTMDAATGSAPPLMDRLVDWAKRSSFLTLLVVITLLAEALTVGLNVINDKLWWEGSAASLYTIGVVDAFFVSVIALPVIVAIIVRLRQAEASAASNTTYLDNILRSSTGMAITATDAEFRVTLFNPAAEEMFGLGIDDVMGRDIRKIHEGINLTPTRFEAALAELRTGKRHTFTMTWGKGDAARIIDAGISGIPGSDGRLSGYVMMARDISGRVRAEAALRESEAKFRTLVEQSLFGVAIIQDGRYAYVNPRHAEMLGYTQEEYMALDSVMHAVHPDDRELVAGNIRKRISGEVKQIRYQFRFVHKDGHTVHVEVHGSTSEYDGRPAILATVLDITGRIKAEEALRESEAKFRNLVEQAADAIVVHDVTGRMLEVNQQACTLSGYSREELLSMNVMELESSMDPAKMQGIWATMVPGEVSTVEGAFRKKDGSSSPMEVRVALFETGGERYIQALVRDITERKEAEARIKELNERLEQRVAQRTEELSASEKKYRMLMEQASDGIGLMGPDGSILSVNRRLCDMAGYSLEEFLGLKLDALFDASDMESVKANIERVRAGETVVTERMGVRKDGSRLPVEISAKMLVDGSVQAIVRDITERKRAEEMLRASEQRLMNVVQNMPVMMNAFDEDWNVVVWNRECERVTGYSSAEVIGNPHIMDLLYPDAHYRESMVGEWVARGNSYRDWEWDITCRDGAVKTVSWSNISGDSPIPGWAAWGVGVDVTARKLAERTLIASERSYRTLAENLPGIVYRVYIKEDNRMRFFNEYVEPITGYSAHELETGEICSIDKLIKEDERAGIILSVREAVREGRPFVLEYTITHKDGRAAHLQERGMPVMGPDNRPAFIDGVIIDITELKKAQAEKDAALARLNDAQKMETIGTLAGGIAHDFNNLLTVIMGEAGVAMSLSGESSPAYACLERVESAAGRATELTRKLLMFSRNRRVSQVAIDVNKTVSDIVGIMSRLIGEDIEVVMEAGDDLWPAWAEASGLEQVVMNLALNARDAMPEGGTLTISTANAELDEAACRDIGGSRPGSFVRISVADSGIGMDEDMIQHIFDPFYTRTESRVGTGLGLSVVYGVVKGVGGWINVSSSPGKGTRFDVYLERSDGDSTTVKREPSKLVKPVGLGESVLLVEDEELVRQFAKRALEAGGYRVTVVSSVEQARREYLQSEEGFDIVFTDVVLPDGSGVQLAEELQEIRPGQKVLLASGYTGKKAQMQDIELGSYPFLDKPYVMDDLLAKLRDILDNR